MQSGQKFANTDSQNKRNPTKGDIMTNENKPTTPEADPTSNGAEKKPYSFEVKKSSTSFDREVHAPFVKLAQEPTNKPEIKRSADIDSQRHPEEQIPSKFVPRMHPQDTENR